MDSEYGLHVECRDRRGKVVFKMDVTGYKDKNLEHYDERFIRLSPIFLDMGSLSLSLAGMFRLSKELARLEAELNLKVNQKWARVKK
ncbi:hypothetical protein [Streptococcus sp. zg-JUN1979]|uniref:hypothetical protein n=1 Tax=Streptococcus sp. zg-JUN1979 TaxID=3391450 RepID=UPI0039A620A9